MSPGGSAAGLSPDRYLMLLEQDARLLAATARRVGHAAPIPTCPGWTVGDCVGHIAEVYQHKIACMRLERRPGQDYEREPPAGMDLLAWFEASLATLVTELRTRGPLAPAYTWWPPDQTVGFWFRRMAQETAVHRVDVEDAGASTTPIDVELAVDGIDELLEMFMSEGWDDVSPEEWGAVNPRAGQHRTIAVRSGGRVWRSTLGPKSIPLQRVDGDADATVAGEPEPVLLWLWGRRPEDAVDLSGDASTLDAFRERLHIATQ